MQYCRSLTAGACYFITANLADRRSSLLTDNIDLLRVAIAKVKTAQAFHIDAIVVLPNHFHLLMTLPPDDANFSVRIGAIKSTFSRQIPSVENIVPSRLAKRERGIWQRRFWEHLIRDDRDFSAHVDYIHMNPVKHGYASKASHWPHSSIRRYIKNGMVSADWGVASNAGEFGER